MMPFESGEPSWQQAVQKAQDRPGLSNAQVEPGIPLLSEKHSNRVIDAPTNYLTPSELPIAEPSRDLPGHYSLARGD